VSLLFDSGERRVDFVLHPTDLSQAAERAFDHALAIAIRNAAQFTLLHANGRRETDNWPDFPSVRTKLARWRSAGTLQGLEDRVRQCSVSKLDAETRNPVVASRKYIERNAVDMIVVATEGRSGLARIIKPSTAEKLARETKLLTLFVPAGGRRFVDGDTGEVSLKRILVPVDRATDPRPAMVRAVNSAALLEDPSLEITLLHVGDGEETSVSDVPDLPYCRWNVEQRRGHPVEQILATADDIAADAIYMSTTWSKAGFGRLEGGVTEGVLAGADCPVVAVPVVGGG
jgi:nucleotide-binding universal stress UspA family protein